jgi:probable F420-dependent oxidoreductase
MKIGINFQLTGKTPHPMELARKCEALGFESMFVNEHVIFPVNPKTPYVANPSEPIPEYYAHFPDPFVALAMAAAVTKTIQLGTAVSLVTEHEPIALAKQLATLDHWSGGRIIYGAGAGWLREESEVMGVNFRRRWEMAVEYLRAMKELWTKEEASFDGEFVKFPPVKCNPKPARKPHIPIHIGAGGFKAGNDRALRNTVAIGDGWMPPVLKPDQMAVELPKLKRMCEEAGRDFNAIEISVSLPPVKKARAQELIERYAAGGVHRVIPTLGGLAFQNDPDIIEKVAEAYIG